MSKMASYLQFQSDKGLWRYRRPVPPECQSALGKKLILQALGTRSEPEAKRLAVPLIDRDNQLFADIIAGDYPRLQDEAVEIVAHHWLRDQDKFSHYRGHEDLRGGGFKDQGELERSLKAYLILKQPRIRIDGKTYREILREAIDQHHDMFSGFPVPYDERQKALVTDHLRRERARREGREPEAIPAALGVRTEDEAAVPSKPRADGPGIPLSELWTLYKNEVKPSAKAEHEWSRAVELLKQHLGQDKPVRLIERSEIVAFKETLLKFPATMPNSFRKMALPDLMEIRSSHEDLKDRPNISPASINKILTGIHAMFEFGLVNEKVTANPAAKVKVAATKGKKTEDRSFTSDQINSILGSSWFTGLPEDRTKWPADVWLTLLGMFTGARLAELAQLHTAHVKTRDGTPFLDFRDDHLSLDLKTFASRRETPIHPMLIKMGFLEFVASRKSNTTLQLFPEFERNTLGQLAGDFSKRFGRLLGKLDMVDKDLVFHSWRHTMKTELRNVTTEDVAESIVGHSGKFYGGGLNLQKLLDALKLVKFEGVKVDHLLKVSA